MNQLPRDRSTSILISVMSRGDIISIVCFASQTTHRSYCWTSICFPHSVIIGCETRQIYKLMFHLPWRMCPVPLQNSSSIFLCEVGQCKTTDIHEHELISPWVYTKKYLWTNLRWNRPNLKIWSNFWKAMVLLYCCSFCLFGQRLTC